MKRIGRSRISLDVPKDIYTRIKRAADKRNVTITRIIIRALLVQLYEEEKYDNKPA